jgi:hypothetical protein
MGDDVAVTGLLRLGDHLLDLTTEPLNLTGQLSTAIDTYLHSKHSKPPAVPPFEQSCGVPNYSEPFRATRNFFFSATALRFSAIKN